MAYENRKSIIFKSELCIGCYSCVVSCMDQNDLDTARDALSWRRIEHVPERGGRLGEVNVSIACMQCEDAACISACALREPSRATLRRATSSCARACASVATPARWPALRRAARFGGDGKMQKCDGCYARTGSVSSPPACATAPPARFRSKTQTMRWRLRPQPRHALV